jgi:two-component system KDP operon response regulator KdpE
MGVSTSALLVHSDGLVSEALVPLLVRHGYSVRQAVSGSAGLHCVRRSEPDVVILDLTLPDLNGIEVCARLRKVYGGPVVVLSADQREQSIVAALDAGADDYVTRPFRRAELLSRLQAAMRRAARTPKRQRVIEAGRLRIDLALRHVRVDGREIRLTRTEFDILSFLAINRNRAVSMEAILEQVWGPHHGDYSQTARVHIGKIRSKIEPAPGAPRYLVTVPGRGYRFGRPRESCGNRLTGET